MSNNAIKPNLLTRWGTLITFGVLLVVGILTWIIKYPETIVSTGRLTGTNAPKPILAKQTAQLAFLRKTNGELVNKGDTIAGFESAADFKEVLRFSQFVDRFYFLLQKENNQEIKKMMTTAFNHLGELQPEYQAFILAYIPYKDYVLGDYSDKKRMLLSKDMKNATASRLVLDEESKLFNKNMSFNSGTLDKNRKLLQDTVISEKKYGELISKNQMRSSYISNASQVNGIQKELIELHKEIMMQKALFQQVVYTLKSKIDDWKNRYLLIASIDGKLVFTKFVQENQIVQMGEIVAYIIPDKSEIYVESLVPQRNFGKVSKNQKVLLTFNAYPSSEYGSVIGKIDYISPIPSDSGYYLIKIILPEKLKTNYNKVIPFIEGLNVQSDIVTKDIRLAESLYYDVIRQVEK